MHLITLESNVMPTEIDSSVWAKIAGGVVVVASMLYALWDKLTANRATKAAADNTESMALRTVDVAVSHWQKLYDVAMAHATRERELRELAERAREASDLRAAATMQEVEGLRGEVAALKRQIEHLSDLITHKGNCA